MQSKNSLAPFALVIGIAMVLQLALIGADSQETPLKVAKKFANAYYYLDADMQSYLCAALAEDGELVDDYLNRKGVEASQRGLSTNYLRHKLTKLHLDVVDAKGDTMQLHLTGTSRVCINPAFMLVGKLFHLAKSYPVDATIDLIKEDGSWRVCGNPFGLNPNA